MAVAENYNGVAGVITGTKLLVISVVSIILGIVSIVIRTAVYPVGTAIWMGLFIAVTAGFGIGTKTKNKCLIITYMVLTILSAVLSFWSMIHFIQSALADAVFAENRCLWPKGIYTYNNFYFQDYTYGTCSSRAARIAVAAILAVAYFAAMIISIIGSGFTCAGVCCKRNSTTTQTTTIVQGTTMQPQQQYIIQQQQQQVAYPPPGYTPGAEQAHTNEMYPSKQ